MDKPLILHLEEAERVIVSAITETARKHELPFYLLEPIARKIYNQIEAAKQREIASAKQQKNDNEGKEAE